MPDSRSSLVCFMWKTPILVDAVRASVWLALLTESEESFVESHYMELVEARDRSGARLLDKIVLDVQRTLPKLLSPQEVNWLIDMVDLARYQDGFAYRQGVTMLAVPFVKLYAHTSPAWALHLFYRFWLQVNGLLHSLVEQFERALNILEPTLVTYLQQKGISPASYAAQWLYPLWIGVEWDWKLVWRFWDMYVAEGVHLHPLCCAVYFASFHGVWMQCDFVTFFQKLKQLPPPDVNAVVEEARQLASQLGVNTQ